MVIKTPRSRTRSFLVHAALASALAAAASSCGGGGDSSSGVPTQLAFTVNWEQSQAAVAGAASVSAPSPVEAAAFATPIPAAVNSIRFILRPSTGADCCVSVIRGSSEFEERRIQLANVPEGQAILEVNGYPTFEAPGGLPVCPTRPPGAGEPCDGEDTLPSFGSDDIPVDVQPGVNVVDVDVYSLPFLLDLDPADGETANENPPFASFAVVDAVHGIDEDIDILFGNAPNRVDGEILELEACEDGATELPDCSEGGSLDVSGFLVTSRAEETLPQGLNDLRIEASNTAPTPRSMVSDTEFFIEEGTTTTVTSTTTSTEDTTTTTLGIPATFCVQFRVTNAVDLVGISYNASYANSTGEFVGEGEEVSCFHRLETNPNSTQAIFNNDVENATLNTAIISAETFSGPVVLAQCEFRQVPPLNLANVSIQVTEATAPDLSSTNATVVVEETQCPL